MITLLITVGALFVAVIGWTLLDPWPWRGVPRRRAPPRVPVAPPATRKSKNQADEERAQN